MLNWFLVNTGLSAEWELKPNILQHCWKAAFLTKDSYFLEMFSNKAITEALHSCRFTECTQQMGAFALFPAVWVRDMLYLCGLHFQHLLFSHILLKQSNQPVIVSSHHLWPWTRRAVKKTKGCDMQIHHRFTFDPFIMVLIDFMRIWIKSCLNH